MVSKKALVFVTPPAPDKAIIYKLRLVEKYWKSSLIGIPSAYFQLEVIFEIPSMELCIVVPHMLVMEGK